MALQYQAVRGMNDLLPTDIVLWQAVEAAVAEILRRYAYRELRFPLVEHTELFTRSIGEVTDIVEKEMYTFEDRGGKWLSLRPEGTASCVRAVLEGGLIQTGGAQRLWYAGPMFRREKPQKGRYRQFHQIGVESFGIATSDIDAELIQLSADIWTALGLTGTRLEINSLGTTESRANYRAVLLDYFQAQAERLDEDSQRRLHTNPMRILDSKNPAMAELIQAAPQIHDHLDAESAEHFAQLRERLTAADIEYSVNPRLVRGLDYYSRTVFEWKTDRLGAQDAICSGGRYDGLVEQLGGRATPAIGFALGMERVVALLDAEFCTAAQQAAAPQVYLAIVGAEAEAFAAQAAKQLRSALPQLRLQVNVGGGSFKAQMRRADRSGAEYALLCGGSEASAQQLSLKPLRSDAAQETLSLPDITARLATALTLAAN